MVSVCKRTMFTGGFVLFCNLREAILLNEVSLGVCLGMEKGIENETKRYHIGSLCSWCSSLLGPNPNRVVPYHLQ